MVTMLSNMDIKWWQTITRNSRLSSLTSSSFHTTRNYSGTDLARFLRSYSAELGQTNIIYNIPHPSILLHIPDKTTRNVLLLLVQEVKRDIIYRRMNLPPSAQQITDPRRPAAHLASTLHRLHSYLRYRQICQGYRSLGTTARKQQWLKKISTCHMLSLHPTHDTNYLSHANTTAPNAQSAHSAHPWTCKNSYILLTNPLTSSTYKHHMT
jgi:hypothetical protein